MIERSDMPMAGVLIGILLSTLFFWIPLILWIVL
jgi:hypothetical protein